MLLVLNLAVILTAAIGIQGVFIHPDSDSECNEISSGFIASQDCRVYYECYYNQMIFKKCEIGTYFNLNYNGCTDQRPSGCDNYWTEADVPTDYFPVAFRLPEATDNNCPNTYSNIKIASQDCRVYYECYEGKMMFKTCPKGTFFYENGCGPKRPPGCNDSWTDVYALTAHFPVATPAPNALQSDQHVNQCVGRENGFVYQPSAASGCRAYNVCWSQRSHAGECPLGFSFNAELRRCDTAGNAHCTEDEMCPAEGVYAFRKLGKCRDYHLCFDGVRNDRRCAEGLQFDEVQKRCYWQSAVRCYECPLVDDVENLVTYVGERRNEYLVCRRGAVIPFHCGLGLVWNAAKQQCDVVQRATAASESTYAIEIEEEQANE